MTEYIPELNRELSGRLLDIWHGRAVGLSAEVQQQYRANWLGGNKEKSTDQPQVTQTVQPVNNCKFLSEDRVRVPGSMIDYRTCLHPETPQGNPVCRCRSCNRNCRGYTEASSSDESEDEPRRHLLFHVMPISFNGAWQRAADNLLARWPLFTGKRVIAIITTNDRTSFKLDPPEVVKDYFRGRGCEFVEVPNDPALREVATWLPLWERVEEFQDTDDPVFYCHAKAVTRPWNPGVTCHPWTRLLFSSLLDFWPKVADELRQWPIAGSFKKVGHGFTGSASTWHYSGSFFWIRCSEAFKFGRWRVIDNVWWGNESWPGRHFPPEHAGFLFKSGTVPSLNNYDPNFLFGSVVPEFQSWCRDHQHERTIFQIKAFPALDNRQLFRTDTG